MAVKLRLRRMGAKKRPYYRIVAADSRNARNGAFIELIGTYNPIVKPAEVKIDKELALKWLSVGATPTDTVRDILSKQGIMKEFHESKITKTEKKTTKKAVVKKEVKTTKKVAAKTTKTTKKEAK